MFAIRLTYSYLFALCTAVGVGLFFHVVTMNAGVVTQENVDFYKTQFPYDNVLYKEKECPECKLPKYAFTEAELLLTCSFSSQLI